ncbi:hypothetical protein [Rubinisphaera margarita]|uniref:hypothetical protein n=1 Tax=Rubinisphaera margarita TaxID=2909586 RepID=UPI001EE81E59|nr:hypothetical protein [Rubinisphaera margarita]MCG6154986.1 hypothetical protein [Rubinisphaera margarita]
MSIDWLSLLIGASPLLIGIILRFILDMRIYPKIIKGLNWTPVRGIFRANPPNLRGEWDVYWESSSKNFPNTNDRHKTARIYQLHDHCYADYAALDERYVMTGKIEGNYITGIWYNPNDRHGYRGAFQLRIVSSKKLEGRWLGFSTTEPSINSDKYTWTKNPI